MLDHITDPSETVRQAAMLAVVPLQLHAAVPRLLELAARPGSPDYATAVEALCGLRDPRGVAVYLTALDDDNPRLRKLAESALLAITDKVPAPRSLAAAKSARLGTAAALSLDRVLATVHADHELARDRPVPPNIPQLFARAGRIGSLRRALRRCRTYPRLLDRPPRRRRTLRPHRPG